MKSYFISSILFSVFLTFLTMNESLFYRMFLLVIVLVLFFITIILFALEYDKENMKAWNKKEIKLKEELYLSFFNKYFKEKFSK
ncbi:MAG: hypothetical protein QXE31_04270 [Candidatus Woesearchaeota archaeon]